jgi:ComEC/Rec2-related protein
MKRTKAFLVSGGGLTSGLIGGNFWTLPFLLNLTILILFLIFLIIFWRNIFLRRTAILGTFTLLGLLYFSVWQQSIEQKVFFDQPLFLEAEVVQCKEQGYSFRCLINTRAPFPARLSLVGEKNLTPGSLVTIHGVVEKLTHQNSYLRGDGVVGIVNKPIIQTLKERPSSWRTLLYKLKAASEKRLQAIFQEPLSSLVTGLIFGGRQVFSPDFVEALKRTNTMHIIAVSGFNITILTEFVRRLLLFFPKRVAFLSTITIIAVFVLMIGAPSSAVRAGLMGVAMLLGSVIGRKVYLPSLILLVGLLMALPNPFVLRYDLGFQLSFLAFTGLVAISPLLEPRLYFIPQPIRGLAAATLGATLATSPLLIPMSGEVSLVGPFVNLLVLPLVPLVMILGLACLSVSWIYLAAGHVLGLILFLPGLFVIRAIEWGASLPFATANWLIGLFVFVISSLMVRIFRRKDAPLH